MNRCVNCFFILYLVNTYRYSLLYHIKQMLEGFFVLSVLPKHYFLGGVAVEKKAVFSLNGRKLLEAHDQHPCAARVPDAGEAFILVLSHTSGRRGGTVTQKDPVKHRCIDASPPARRPLASTSHSARHVIIIRAKATLIFPRRSARKSSLRAAAVRPAVPRPCVARGGIKKKHPFLPSRLKGKKFGRNIQIEKLL